MQHLVQRLLSPRHLRCMNVCACDPACMRCIDQVKVNYVCGYMLVFATAEEEKLDKWSKQYNVCPTFKF